jgi:hypothetical protein
MKPAETVAVVVAIPVLAALFVAEIAAARMSPTQTVRAAEVVSPTLFEEIVVTAKRPAKG